ncbi:MAG: hypothetical protein AB1805_02965 [Nitrospirota bacterium]
MELVMELEQGYPEVLYQERVAEAARECHPAEALLLHQAEPG